MKGDFSKIAFRPEENFTGVLHQQGRVLLDQDWNAATAIGSHLRRQLGEDVVGAGVVAVPVAGRDQLQVLEATVAGGGQRADVRLKPGRGWIDGLQLHLPEPGELFAALRIHLKIQEEVELRPLLDLIHVDLLVAVLRVAGCLLNDDEAHDVRRLELLGQNHDLEVAARDHVGLVYLG